MANFISMKDVKEERPAFYRLTRMTTQRKLIVAYVLILAIPIIGFSLYYFDNFKTNIEYNLFRTSYQDVRSMKDDVERNIETCESILQSIISNKELLNFIARQEDFSTLEMIEFNKYHIVNLERVCNSNPNIYQLRFFANNSKIYEISPILYSEDRIEDAYWRDDVISLEGGNYWRFNHLEEPALQTGTSIEEIVSLYRDVRHMGRRVGIVEVNMRARDFFHGMYQDSAQSDSFICVVDRNKQMHWNKNNGMLKDRSWNMDRLEKYLLQYTKKAREGDFILELGEEEIAVVYAFIPKIDSYIYKFSSLTALTYSIKKTRNSIIIIAIVVISILSAVTYIITSLILKKLRIIISTMHKVQDGDLDVDIPVWGGDELGELAHHFRKMLQNIKELISMVLRKQAVAKDAEIRALQSQINSHFIYNVLESIKMMAEIEGQHEISDSITSLGKLMRYSMNWEHHYVELKHELNYIKNYIALSNMRYDNETKLEIDVPIELRNYKIPKMSIQPLVENAIKHGINPKDTDGTIQIRAYIRDQTVLIEVTDDGVGISSDELNILQQSIRDNMEVGQEDKAGKKGIGLGNVNERIQLFYGTDYDLNIKSEKDMYTTVTLELPYRQML